MRGPQLHTCPGRTKFPNSRSSGSTGFSHHPTTGAIVHVLATILSFRLGRDERLCSALDGVQLGGENAG